MHCGQHRIYPSQLPWIAPANPSRLRHNCYSQRIKRTGLEEANDKIIELLG